MRLGRLEVCSLGGQFRSQKANRLRESGWNIPFLVWEEKTANKKESTQLMWKWEWLLPDFSSSWEERSLKNISPNIFSKFLSKDMQKHYKDFYHSKKVFFSRPHCTASLCRLVWLLMPVLGQSWYWLYPHVLSGPPRLGFVLSITFHLTPRWNCLWKYMNIQTTAPSIPVLSIEVFLKTIRERQIESSIPSQDKTRGDKVNRRARSSRFWLDIQSALVDLCDCL